MLQWSFFVTIAVADALHIALPSLDRPRASLLSMCEEPPQPSGDWRELRARLVAQEQAKERTKQKETEGGIGEGYVYESPLIEQGSVILGGTKQEFGFALRQQYFHKSVMLLLHHDETFTKGIILNRPSAIELDGWRVWFGGDVAEGGMFRGSKGHGEREVVLLHSLEGEAAERLSLPVIKGVSYTTLEAAQALVEGGHAKKSDFWMFVGYAGWAPKQLQGEVDRHSWFLASADSGTLLKELLRQGTELPPPSEGTLVAGDGLSTWSTLMNSIGRGDEVERTAGSLADKMLLEWVRAHLLPRPPRSTKPLDSALPSVNVGTVLRAGTPADRVLLSSQFLHKSLMLVIHQLPGRVYVAAVLNRPTVNLVKFNADGSPVRCIGFGGDGQLRGGGLDIDQNGILWLHYSESFGGTPIGDSGLWRLPGSEAAQLIKAGTAQASDFLLLSGVVGLVGEELDEMFGKGEMYVVDDARSLWPQVWSLCDAGGVDTEIFTRGGAAMSDGTSVWWLASQLGSLSYSSDGLPIVTAPPIPATTELADAALAEWLKFFAGHKPVDEDL